jgi:hypothetical protein
MLMMMMMMMMMMTMMMVKKLTAQVPLQLILYLSQIMSASPLAAAAVPAPQLKALDEDWFCTEQAYTQFNDAKMNFYAPGFFLSQSDCSPIYHPRTLG